MASRVRRGFACSASACARRTRCMRMTCPSTRGGQAVLLDVSMTDGWSRRVTLSIPGRKVVGDSSLIAVHRPPRHDRDAAADAIAAMPATRMRLSATPLRGRPRHRRLLQRESRLDWPCAGRPRCAATVAGSRCSARWASLVPRRSVSTPSSGPMRPPSPSTCSPRGRGARLAGGGSHHGYLIVHNPLGSPRSRTPPPPCATFSPEGDLVLVKASLRRTRRIREGSARLMIGNPQYPTYQVFLVLLLLYL